MLSLFQFTSPPHECSYLPAETALLQYEIVGNMTADEYRERLTLGWRRFGHALFTPKCPTCNGCQSLRVPVARFEPNRSQRRAWKTNRDLRVIITEPSATAEKLDLYDRYHAFQAGHRGWAEHEPKGVASYFESFVDNPVPTLEFQYRLGQRLIGVGYVDQLPEALSAIYFFYDPEDRHRSLGTFNVLRVIDAAAERNIPFVYLGYYVRGCQSLEYKANFTPNEVLDSIGRWVEFRV